jgi:arylformamidase
MKPESASQASDAIAGNTSLWRTMSTEVREREYSPSSCIGGNYQPFMEAYRAQSIQARSHTESRGATWHVVRYGGEASQRVDLCVPAKASHSASPLPALLVFIHGGYWQALSAADSLFAASACVDHGHAFAAIDYTLAPDATLPLIVDECRRALACLTRQAAALGFDAQRIVVAGSSAGAHLAAMVARPGWRASNAAITVRAAVLVSGIYELEPLVGTSINTALQLDADSAHAQSPARLPLARFPQALVAWGEVETQEFKRQSRHFARDLQRAGTAAQTLEVPLRNHFDVILDLANPATSLGARTLSLLDATAQAFGSEPTAS